ncbi:MAG: restriction endonuclease [Verrucomicrobiia bacterium]
MGRRRRRRQPDAFELLLELAGPVIALLLILGFLVPGLLQAVFAMIVLVGIVIVCGVVAVVLFLVIRGILRNRHKQTEFGSLVPNPSGPYPEVAWPKDDPPKVKTLEEKLRAIDWFQFEKLVSAIYDVPGCTVRRLGGAKPDGGVDLMVEQGGRRIVVQCKHWRTWSVGVRHIRELVGAMAIANAQKGVLVTLRGCTQDARDLAREQGIDIIDEAGLANLMQMSDGSVDRKILALLDDTRKFCPKCESELVIRTAEKGFNRGSQFWGCSNYPRSRYILRDA